MRSTIADYQLLGPAGPHAPIGAELCWRARPPTRLAYDGDVVVTELADPGEQGWPDLAQRLCRLAAVRSPHLVRLIEAGREPVDPPCAWVSSAGLGLRPVQPGGRPDAVRSVAAAARGLHALHQGGVAHGAVTAAAILTSEEAGSDIVIAPPVAVRPADRYVLDATDPVSLWGEGASRAGDVWSLGAALHHLVTGQPLHPGIHTDTAVTAVQRVLFEPPEVALGDDDPIGDLVRSCLAPDPADRPPTASALADELDVLAARS